LFSIKTKRKTTKNQKETRGRFNVGTPFLKRPKEVKKRTTFGHGELDTVGIRAEDRQKGCVATFLEGKVVGTRNQMPNRSASSIGSSLRKTLILILPEAGFFRASQRIEEKNSVVTPIIEMELRSLFYFAILILLGNEEAMKIEWTPKGVLSERTNFDHCRTGRTSKKLYI